MKLQPGPYYYKDATPCFSIQRGYNQIRIFIYKFRFYLDI